MNIGIIGCGKITQVRHAPEYAAHPDCTISKVYDLNKERAREVAKQYGALSCETYQEILTDPAIDAVSICVMNKDHARFSIEALNAGKNVLCEKPMAVTLEECEEMVKAADRSKKILLIGQNQRLLKSHEIARKMIQDGKLGNVLTFRFTFGHSGPERWSVDKGNGTWFFQKANAAFGAMNDLGIHKIDLMQFILDDVAEDAVACMATLDKHFENGSPIEVEDNAVCLFRMKKRAIGTVTASWTYYGKEDNSTVICGSKGRMKIYDDQDHSIVLEKHDGETEYFDIDMIQTNANQTSTGVINEFYEAVVNRKKSMLDCREILKSMQTAFACIESSEINEWVKIKR